MVELRVLEFKRDCIQGLSKIVRKMQEKSPLRFATVRQLAFLACLSCSETQTSARGR